MSWAAIAKKGQVAEKKRVVEASARAAAARREKLRKNARIVRSLQCAEVELCKVYTEFLEESKHGPSIVTRDDVVDFISNTLHEDDTSHFHRLPVYLIRQIIYNIDDGKSPLLIPPNSVVHKEEKNMILVGKSIMGIPYGIWRIYTCCGINDAYSVGHCDHMFCVSNAIDIMITSISSAISAMCKLEPAVPVPDKDDPSVRIVLHKYLQDTTKGLCIGTCHLTDDFHLHYSNRRVHNTMTSVIKKTIKMSECERYGLVSRPYS